VGEGFTPFQLSYLAISGGLKEEGIPGGDQLISAYKDGEISAEDVVAAGAESNRLGTAASDTEDYAQSVDRFLEILRRDARSSSN
jgi:phage FluMu protein gp41